MNEFITIKIERPFTHNGESTVWNFDDNGFPVALNTLKIADMANKRVVFTIAGRKNRFSIDPQVAMTWANILKTFFSLRDGNKMVVIPSCVCDKVEA